MARASLKEALRMAVDGEQRYGIREEARPELDKRWDRVIDLMLQVLKC